jgi:hypothetical protein
MHDGRWGVSSDSRVYISRPGNIGGAMALTEIEIRKAKPTEKAYRISDGGGLYLRVTPSGGKL